MLQNSRIHQLTCNYIGHQDQFITAICTRSECDKPSALCPKCILPFHKQCDGHITYLGDLSAKVSHFKSEILWIDNILESLIK